MLRINKIIKVNHLVGRVLLTGLCTEKTAITSADMLNDRILQWYEKEGIPVLRILTDRGSEYKDNTIENHVFRVHHELFLSIDGIEHTTTKTYPQTNGICERFHKTMKNEFFDTAKRKKIYYSLEVLQWT